MNQRAIVLALLAIIAIPILILLGQWSATDPVIAGASALALVGVFVLFQLGAKCWLLIPLLAAWTGSLNILPGHFAPRDIAVGIVVPILVLIWIVRRFPLRFRFGKMEFMLLFSLAFLGQAFIRNPTGFSVLGGERVGGRPYFEIAVSAVGFLVLAIQVVDLKSVKQMVFASFAGSVLSAIYETLAGIFPRFGYESLRFYQGATVSRSASQYLGISGGVEVGTGRRIYLGKFGKPITSFVFSFRSPLELLRPRNFLFALAIMFAGVCVLLSGFRSAVAGLGLMMIIASILHRKSYEIIILFLIGAPLLGALLILQGSVLHLPLPAQRALSFLPADWDSPATIEAEGSTEWRIEMWKTALTSDRYIRDKWLGDGYGYTMDELQHQRDLQLRGVHSHEKQDYYLTVGSYHSGPVETIKRVGYFGLAVLLVTMGVFVRESVRIVNLARNTPYFPYALYVAIPIVALPIEFVLIFGEFKGAMTQLLLAAGMFRIIETSIERWSSEMHHENTEAATT